MLKVRTIKFESQGKQLEIDEFKSSLQGLNKSNRWIKLSDSMPWAEIEVLHNSKLGNNKLGAGITNGFTFINHHNWDAYNESSDLELQIQLFEKRFGYLPAKLYAEKYTLTRLTGNYSKLMK